MGALGFWGVQFGRANRRPFGPPHAPTLLSLPRLPATLLLPTLLPGPRPALKPQILSNFGVDVLEALSGTCTLYSRRRIGAAQLAADALLAFLLVVGHAAVLMCEAILFSVAMNSSRQTLLALLIAANFVELKGQVYKRTDTTKLWALACMVRVRFFRACVGLLRACGLGVALGQRMGRRLTREAAPERAPWDWSATAARTRGRTPLRSPVRAHYCNLILV